MFESNGDPCFSLIFHVHSLWKRQKTKSFQTFSIGVEMENWVKVDLHKWMVSVWNETLSWNGLSNIFKPQAYLGPKKYDSAFFEKLTFKGG